MNRDMLLQHLNLAERHIKLDETHVAKQEALISELDREGHDTTDAWALLATLQAAQALHLEDRDRILAELAA